jgi:molecular chaperone HscA
VEAASLLEAIGAALGKDCDLLDEGERAEIERGIASLRTALQGTDHRRIKAAAEDLNRATETFAGRRMDRAVSGALAGRRLDEVR